jgi:N-acetylglucosamine-6-phosphate deacetylase
VISGLIFTVKYFLPATKAYIADRIFTGEAWLNGHAIVVDKETIVDVVASASLDKGMTAEHFPGCFLAPAFIDLQIYGAHEKLLAVYPEADSLFKLNEHCNNGGAFLPAHCQHQYIRSAL